MTAYNYGKPISRLTYPEFSVLPLRNHPPDVRLQGEDGPHLPRELSPDQKPSASENNFEIKIFAVLIIRNFLVEERSYGMEVKADYL